MGMDRLDIIEQLITSSIHYPLWTEWENGSKLFSNSYSMMFQAINRKKDTGNMTLVYTLISSQSEEAFEKSNSVVLKELESDEINIVNHSSEQVRSAEGLVTFYNEMLFAIYTDRHLFGYLSIIRVEKIFNLYELVRTKVVEVNDGFIKQFLLDTVKSLNSIRKIGLQFTEIKLHDVFFTTEQTIKIGHIENYYYYKKFLSKGFFSSFVSPEQIYSSINDNDIESIQGSMIYSLGVCLYQLINTKTASKADERLIAPIYDTYSEKIKFISLYKSKPPHNVSDYLYNIVLKMIDPDPHRRYHSISALLSDLKHFSTDDQLIIKKELSGLEIRSFYNNIYPICFEQIISLTNSENVSRYRSAFDELAAVGFTGYTNTRNEKSKKPRIILASLLTTVVLCGILIVCLRNSSDAPVSHPEVNESVTDNTTQTVSSITEINISSNDKYDLNNDGKVTQDDFTLWDSENEKYKALNKSWDELTEEEHQLYDRLDVDDNHIINNYDGSKIKNQYAN